MAEKLWQKNTIVNSEIERYTVGMDRELDLFLAPYDILGSIAHITMNIVQSPLLNWCISLSPVKNTATKNIDKH